MDSGGRLVTFGLASLLFTSGCGGGGGGGASSTVPGPAQGPMGTARFTLTVPKSASASARSPRYISPATQSVVILAAGVKTTVVLSTANPNCTQGSNGLTCVVDGGVPVGTNSVSVSAYGSVDGSGAPLSTATIVVNVAAGQITMVDLTLNGVVSALSLVVSPAVVSPGTPSTSTVTLNALDSKGNTIIGPGSYADANGNALTITLTDSDSSGATHLSSSTAAAPGASFALSYNGSAIPSFTISASAPGVSSANATVAVGGAAHPLFVATSQSSATPSSCGGSYPAYVTRYPTSSQGMGQAGGVLNFQAVGPIMADPHGNLFVSGTDASGQHSGMLEYPLSATCSAPPAATLACRGSVVDSGDRFWAIATDGSGNRTLAHCSSASGQTDRSITGIANLPPTWAWGAHGVAVDSHDNVYTDAEDTMSSQARIYEFPPTASGVASPIGSYEFTIFGGAADVGVAVDQHTDMVWVWPTVYGAQNTNANPEPGVSGYPQGAATPSSSRSNFTNSLDTGRVSQTHVKSMAFDDFGNAYVDFLTSGFFGEGIAVFGPGSGSNYQPIQLVRIGASTTVTAMTAPVTATPPPSGSPGSPSAAVAPSPASFSFPGSGSAYAQGLTVAEAGYSGTWAASSANTAIATVAPGGAANAFTVSPVNAGSTSITVRDASGKTATVPVTVSITGFTLHGSRRSPR